MGCVAVQIKSKKDKYSSTLPLSLHPDNLNITLMSRGITINPKATASYMKLTTNHHEEYLRLPHDYDCKSALIVVRKKSSEEFEEIKESITSYPLFRDTDEDILVSLIENMMYYILKPNETVFHQGEPGYNFFLIASGIYR